METQSKLVDDIFSFEEISKAGKSKPNRGIRKPNKMKTANKKPELVAVNNSQTPTTSIKKHTALSYFIGFWNHERQPSNNQLLNF